MNYEQAIQDVKTQLHQLVMKDWLENDVLTAKWFGILAFLLLYYLIFILLVDKKRTTKILLFGCLMAVGSLIYEIIGTEFGYWEYLKRTIPTIPSFFIQSVTVIPITYMLVYQYCHTWLKFILFDAIVTLVLCLVFLPVLTALSIYQPTDGWQAIYNFPVWFIAAILTRALILWWVNSEQKQKEKEA